jgi:hypothetical protein
VSVGLYSNGMHDFILAESELGTRVAHAISDTDCDPMGWFINMLYREYCEANERLNRVTSNK